MQFRKMIIPALCLTFAVSVFASDEPVKHYGVKQSTPNTGTSLTKEIVKAGTIPLNKPYGELTDQQKTTLIDEYDHMPAGDEPPFPVKGLIPIYRAIANAHEANGFASIGKFNATVEVDSQGNPQKVQVLDSPDDAVSEAATLAMMSIKYKPAVCSGQPCSMLLPIHAELVSPISSTAVENGLGTTGSVTHYNTH